MSFLAWLVARAMVHPPVTGREALIGASGEARTSLDPSGTVFVRGELWRASAERPVPAGEPVRVLSVDGLTLRVEPLRGERNKNT
jgi:membrane-bound serine protease (ClpP class)